MRVVQRICRRVRAGSMRDLEAVRWRTPSRIRKCQALMICRGTRWLRLRRALGGLQRRWGKQRRLSMRGIFNLLLRRYASASLLLFPISVRYRAQSEYVLIREQTVSGDRPSKTSSTHSRASRTRRTNRRKERSGGLQSVRGGKRWVFI